MSNVIVLPDHRYSKAAEDIMEIIRSIDPPVHTVAALGILEVVKYELISEVVDDY